MTGSLLSTDFNDCDEDVLGNFITKRFHGHGNFYGIVASYRTPYFKVLYEDGDVEEMSRSELSSFLVDKALVPSSSICSIRSIIEKTDSRKSSRKRNRKSEKVPGARDSDLGKLIESFHNAVCAEDVSAIARILYSPAEYSKLLSPLITDVNGELGIYTELHDDLSRAEKSMERWKDSIREGDTIDIFRPRFGAWYLAKVLSLRSQGKAGDIAMRIHFINWNKRYDESIHETEMASLRVAPPGSITRAVATSTSTKKRNRINMQVT